MAEVVSVVTIHENRRQAEEAVTELQGAGIDRKKISIVCDVKTGRVFVVCDEPWFHPARGLRSRGDCTLNDKRQAPSLIGLVPALT
jgi:hypothetical protein